MGQTTATLSRMNFPSTRAERAALLSKAQVMLLFTPTLTGAHDAMEVLEAVLEHVDIVQVRVKSLDGESSAREHRDLTSKVLELVQARNANHVLVLVNDRVDVARALFAEGCAGVHIGQDDCPPALARESLGPDALIGLSTHNMSQVAHADGEIVDYLGFGPIHPTATKGYRKGVGAERCWVAASTAGMPVFPIGGIDAHNASELTNIGRAAVSSAILSAEDPAHAAEALRTALELKL